MNENIEDEMYQSDVPTAAISDNEDGDIVSFSEFSSSNIAAPIRYSPSKQELYIRFHSGATWTYSGVAQSTYESLIAAPSVGKYFQSNIRNNYPASQAA